jgi:hypothetical protein
MKTRTVMVSEVKDDLRGTSTCPPTENKRSTGHEVAEMDQKQLLFSLLCPNFLRTDFLFFSTPLQL